MPLLTDGVAFSLGSSNGADPSMGKSLDEMIKERRQEQSKASKRGPKKPSNADRAVGAGRAKRQAAVNTRRGIGQDKKPNPMEVEREVYRQSRKTENAKKAGQKKVTGGRIAPDSSQRKAKNDKRKNDNPPPAIFGGRAPPKKAIEAAVKGMEAAGFKVPNGHQVVMTFVPAAVASPAPAPTAKKGDDKPKGGRPRRGGKK